MKHFLGTQTGRVLFVHLTHGDDILKCVRQACKEAGITTGILSSGIGSTRQIIYHYPDSLTEKPLDIEVKVDRISELVSMQGIILEGEPHLHAMLTEKGGGICHGAHVEEGCEIMYLCEISIIEVEGLSLGRRSGKYGGVTHFEEI